MASPQHTEEEEKGEGEEQEEEEEEVEEEEEEEEGLRGREDTAMVLPTVLQCLPYTIMLITTTPQKAHITGDIINFLC